MHPRLSCAKAFWENVHCPPWDQGMPRGGYQEGERLAQLPCTSNGSETRRGCAHRSPREIRTINSTIKPASLAHSAPAPSFIAHTTLIPREGQNILHRTLLRTGLLKETLQSAIIVMCLPGAFACRQEQLTAKGFLM